MCFAENFGNLLTAAGFALTVTMQAGWLSGVMMQAGLLSRPCSKTDWLSWSLQAD